MKNIYVFLLLFSIVSYAQTTLPVMDIATRRVPWLKPYLEFEILKKNPNKDYFSIEKKGIKILITGNNNNSLSRGLGHYLRFVAHKSLSHLGENLSKPNKISYPQHKIINYSPFEYRYALNYCTLSYSMSFYTWQDWEKELDWLALNGVNLALMPLGNEIIWQRTLMKFGYSKEETKKYIATPTFSAWWQMGNLEGWYGSITDIVIEEQKQLAHKVFERMRALGIEPIYQGFYGNIPTSFKDKYMIKAIPQGKWAGGFQRPDFLSPSDIYFDKIANIYYSEIKKEYGDFNFFGGDPFHEGGQIEGINIGQAAKLIQAKMQENFPNSTWVLQGWGENPSDEILKVVNKNTTLVLDLEGENLSNWEQRKAYINTPFIWCQITNFGEKTGMYGKIQHFADETYRIQKSKFAHYMKGIGIIPEGIYNNPVVYDFTLDLAWQEKKSKFYQNSNDWIKKYVWYRYGKTNPYINQAWDILLNTVYKSHLKYQQGAPESMLCARPALGLKSVSSWGTNERQYSYNELKKAVKLFLKADSDFSTSETYQIDKIDLLRQLNSDKSLILYHKIEKNILDKNLKEFKHNRNLFLNLIQLQDKLLGVNKYFRLNTFLDKAENSTQDKNYKKLAVESAKVQITYWGNNSNKNTDLRDYAHKEWNGILSSLYYTRWKLFFDEVENALKENREIIYPDFYEIEKKWTKNKARYRENFISKKELNKIIEVTLD